MPCYPLKITSEPIITTLGSKPCRFQNSNEFWPNSPNLILFFSFFLFSSPTRPRRHPSRLFSLPLSYSTCPIPLDTKKRGEPKENLAKIALPSLPLTSTTLNPQPASSHRPGEFRNPTCKPLLSPTSPLLSLKDRGHLELDHADQGAGDKSAPATTPPVGPSHRRHCPTACCRPRRLLAIP
jgi:hypothetical protein